MEQRKGSGRGDRELGALPSRKTRKDTRVALLMPVENVTSSEEEASTGQGETSVAATAPSPSASDHAELAPPADGPESGGGIPAPVALAANAEPSSWRLAAPWAVGLGIFALIATVLLFLANGQTARAPGVPGTAATPPITGDGEPGTSNDLSHRDILPTSAIAGQMVARAVPTPASGYRLFVDAPDGFMMQYPQDWAVAATSPGARFTQQTGTQSPLYWVQVDLPDPWSLTEGGLTPQQPTNGTQTPADANSALSRAWVSYVMSNLATLYPNDDFIPDTTPLPPVTFGGVQWQQGSALLSTRNVQVKVLATVYNGTPYIISLYGADGAFAAGEDMYFDPMLNSLTFVDPPQQQSTQP